MFAGNQILMLSQSLSGLQDSINDIPMSLFDRLELIRWFKMLTMSTV